MAAQAVVPTAWAAVSRELEWAPEQAQAREQESEPAVPASVPVRERHHSLPAAADYPASYLSFPLHSVLSAAMPEQVPVRQAREPEASMPPAVQVRRSSLRARGPVLGWNTIRWRGLPKGLPERGQGTVQPPANRP